MGFTKKKERTVSKHEEYIRTLAKETITLDTFDDKLFITYDGTPVIAIEDSCTPEGIVTKIEKMRENFVNSKMKCYAPKFMDLLFG